MATVSNEKGAEMQFIHPNEMSAEEVRKRVNEAALSVARLRLSHDENSEAVKADARRVIARRTNGERLPTFAERIAEARANREEQSAY